MDLPLHPAFFSPINSTIVRSEEGLPLVPAMGVEPRGESFRLRAAGPADREGVAAFLARLDRETRYLRYWSHAEAANLALLDRLEAADHSARETLLAVVPRHGGEWIVGHAEWVADEACAAGDPACGVEAGLMVEGAWRRRGIGRALLGGLARLAAAVGWRRMHGEVLYANDPMMKLARGLGFSTGRSRDPRTLRVELTLPTP